MYRGSSHLLTREEFCAPILCGGGYKKRLHNTNQAPLSKLLYEDTHALPPFRYFPDVVWGRWALPNVFNVRKDASGERKEPTRKGTSLVTSAPLNTHIL
jgi:hypothetical protein